MMTATLIHDLHYPCGTTIRAGETVRIVEEFRVNRERKPLLRIEWGGRWWTARKEDLR